MSGSRFTRKPEDFSCRRCRAKVRGNGYTNHCPECLWSRHVDVMPGDRAEKCGGMMEPVGLDQKGGAYVILHRCEKCGTARRNKAAKQDWFEKILELSSRPHT